VGLEGPFTMYSYPEETAVDVVGVDASDSEGPLTKCAGPLCRRDSPWTWSRRPRGTLRPS